MLRAGIGDGRFFTGFSGVFWVFLFFTMLFNNRKV